MPTSRVQPLARYSYRIEARRRDQYTGIRGVSAGVHVLVSWERVRAGAPVAGRPLI